MIKAGYIYKFEDGTVVLTMSDEYDDSGFNCFQGMDLSNGEIILDWLSIRAHKVGKLKNKQILKLLV